MKPRVEKREMIHEMQAEIRALQNDIKSAETTNKELIDYVDLLKRSLIELLHRAQHDYKGKDISEEKGKSRTLKTFMAKALSFAKAFGLAVKSIAMKKIKTGNKNGQ